MLIVIFSFFFMLFIMFCGCFGGLFWGGVGGGMGVGGVGVGGFVLVLDFLVMGDSSGLGFLGSSCRWKRRLMICWYCFLWVGGRVIVGFCFMEFLRLRGRGIFVSIRVIFFSLGIDCVLGGSVGCSRVGLRGRVIAFLFVSLVFSIGVSSFFSFGLGFSLEGGLGVFRRIKSFIRGGFFGRFLRFFFYNF